MTVITLKNNESEYFDLIVYPDGQHHIKLKLDKLDVKESIEIKCRIKEFSELEVLMLLVSTLNKYDYRIENINFIYLFGMRSDRAFEEGQCNYVKAVLAPIVNEISKYCESCSIMMPHSTYGISQLNATSEFVNHPDTPNEYKYETIIFGDKSSTKWSYYFQEFEQSEIIHFDKVRKISGDIFVSLEDQMLNKIKEDISGKPILIFDDLCDGGATFISEAKYLIKKFPDRKLHLFVSHGIFSKGFDELFKYFDKIITTNSYEDWDNFHPKLQIIEVF